MITDPPLMTIEKGFFNIGYLKYKLCFNSGKPDYNHFLTTTEYMQYNTMHHTVQ